MTKPKRDKNTIHTKLEIASDGKSVKITVKAEETLLVENIKDGFNAVIEALENEYEIQVQKRKRETH